MARGYKRDSRGRFAGGYGAGALGGKGAYSSRPNSGKGSRGSQARGGTAKLQQPKPQRTRKVLKGVGKKVGGLSTRQKTALVQIGVKGALLGGGYIAATKVMNKGEARLTGGKPLSGSTTANFVNYSAMSKASRDAALAAGMVKKPGGASTGFRRP